MRMADFMMLRVEVGVVLGKEAVEGIGEDVSAGSVRRGSRKSMSNLRPTLLLDAGLVNLIYFATPVPVLGLSHLKVSRSTQLSPKPMISTTRTHLTNALTSVPRTRSTHHRTSYTALGRSKQQPRITGLLIVYSLGVHRRSRT